MIGARVVANISFDVTGWGSTNRKRHHSTMTTLTLYSAQTCPYAQRARITLAEKGIPHNRVEVDLNNRPEDFLALTVSGSVPVLVHDGRVIHESLVVCEYLDEVFDTTAPRLLPDEPHERAWVRAWAVWAAGHIGSPTYKLLNKKGNGEELRAQLCENLVTLEQRCFQKRKGVYFVGDELTLLDVAYYSFFERFVVFEERDGFKVPAECKGLINWRATMPERPGVASAGMSRDAYLAEYADSSNDGAACKI